MKLVFSGRTWIPVVLGAVTCAGCGGGKPTVVAPTEGFLTLQAEPPVVQPGESTTISAALSRLDGAPPPETAEVTLHASAGQLEHQTLRLRNGRATTVYRPDTSSGVARITASSGNLRAEVSVQISPTTPGNISLATDPLVLPASGGDVQTIATVSAADGALIANATVIFSTSAGEFSESEVRTNQRGEARTTLRTTATATVRAGVAGGPEAFTAVRVRDDVAVRVSVSPEPVAGLPVTVSATLSNPEGAPATGDVRFALGDGQIRELHGMSGLAQVIHTWATPGLYSVSAQFTDPNGFLTIDYIQVRVRDKAAEPEPAPSPEPAPEPGEEESDEIDMNKVTFLHTDVSGWRISSRVTRVRIGDPPVCIEHTMAGRWRDVGGAEGNPWVFANINGRWYAATYEWLRPGQTCKNVDRESIGPHTKKSPIEGWRPRSGEMVGFMVSGLARDSTRSVEERSNVVLVRWP
jgi:hypothetical protein